MTAVRLDGVPVRLFDAWEQHSDALMREYAIGATGEGHPYSLGDVARARNARIAVGSLVRAAAHQEDGTLSAVDVTFTPAAADVEPGDFSMLQAVLDDANIRSRSGEFLTMPSLPEVVALRDWVCEEVVGQSSGREPRPWNGAIAGTSDAPLAVWSGVAELPNEEPWLVGDDHNRIVAASDAALRLLRWEAHDIVGQRILAVIPPRFREAHVAGFTHATVTGEHRLLGQPLDVHAWTHDGHEVPVTLTLEHMRAEQGRSVYVARLSAAMADDAT